MIGIINVWTVYQPPTDFPDQYVAPFRIERLAGDDFSVLECWSAGFNGFTHHGRSYE